MQITINKTGIVLPVNTEELPSVSKEFIFAYGLRQILNDCHSSIQRKDFETEEAFQVEVMVKVNAKLRALESGDIMTRQSSVEPIDPVERIALRMAKESVKAALKTKGLTVKKIGEEKFIAFAQSYLEKSREKLEKLARAELKRLAEIEEVEIDLDDLK